MPRKRVKHTAEYKHEALRRVLDGNESKAAVADALGLPKDTLYRWLREYKAKPDEAFRGNGKLTSQDEEIRQLRRKVARLEEEREVLKKQRWIQLIGATLYLVYLPESDIARSCGGVDSAEARYD